MGNKLAPQEKKLYRHVDEILHYMWDPVGVAGIAQARDEYHSYLPQVFKLVLNNKNKDEIAGYLVSIEKNQMGVAENEKAALEVAKVLLDTREVIIDDGF